MSQTNWQMRFGLLTILLIGLNASIGSPALGIPTCPSDVDVGVAHENEGPRLLIDPLLIAEAAEVWSLMGSESNPVWPGWKISETPLLFYLPARQDVLINHPDPPEGFDRYDGPVRFPAGAIYIRDGKTFFDLDGQNTSKVVAGVKTLVVADTLSNRKQQVGGMFGDPRTAEEKLATLDYFSLAADPYSQMQLITHEAFHVFQAQRSPGKGANEGALASYPTLSAYNNVGFALEGAALARALEAEDSSKFRAAAIDWLAVRLDRRFRLDGEAIAYEDGIEFLEGLAKYVEYYLLDVLEGRKASPILYYAQGFRGFDDLRDLRRREISKMLRHMKGEVNVNNDPYGTAPLRMRLYYSGMAIAAVLDRLDPDWKRTIFTPEATLTRLATGAIGASADELRLALESVRSGPTYEPLLREKRELEEEGARQAKNRRRDILEGPNSLLVIDYSALDVQDVGMGYTPFGVTRVDEHRTIYSMVPISARIREATVFRQTRLSPVLHDREKRQFAFQLAERLGRDELVRRAGRDVIDGSPGEIDRLSLPGVDMSIGRATIEFRDGVIAIRLVR